jgi:hypothetical protein
VNASATDLANTKVFASTKIETESTQNQLTIYLQSFRPNFDYWLTLALPENITYSVITGNPIEYLQNGPTIQIRMKTSDLLLQSETKTPLLVLKDANGTSTIQVFPAPKDLPSIILEGSVADMKNLNYLLTPSVSNGQYAIALEYGEIKFFEKFNNFVLAFREISEGEKIYLASGNVKFAYLEKVELNRPFYTPGIWKFLDEDFEPVGRIASFEVFGQTVYPEGHGLTASPAGLPVVMSYVPRNVDSSWLKDPFKAPILDCVFSELKGGTAIRNFSVWNWMNSHREVSKKYLDGVGDRAQDLTSKGNPVDFCHANSLDFSPQLNAYLVSLRSIDLVMVIDKNLKNVNSLLYAKNARQHFARAINKNQISSFNNYTGQPNSKFAVWSKVKNVWKLKEYPLPISIPYCGNAKLLSDFKLWVAGGCANFDGNTAGVLYSLRTGKPIEIARMRLPNSGGSYRVDLYKL